jgi:hypothetical protein
MKERGQHTQNIILAHRPLVMSYESLENHLYFKDFRKGIYIHLYFRIMFDNARKLVALIVCKSLGVMALSFTYPNNNHNHQHGIGKQKVRPYKEKDLTSVNSFIVKNP